MVRQILLTRNIFSQAFGTIQDPVQGMLWIVIVHLIHVQRDAIRGKLIKLLQFSWRPLWSFWTVAYHPLVINAPNKLPLNPPHSKFTQLIIVVQGKRFNLIIIVKFKALLCRVFGSMIMSARRRRASHSFPNLQYYEVRPTASQPPLIFPWKCPLCIIPFGCDVLCSST